jgi:predicted CXXCH cytochrome family protein
MTAQPPPSRGHQTWVVSVLGVVSGGAGVALVVALAGTFLHWGAAPLEPPPLPRTESLSVPRELARGERHTVWWDVLAPSARDRAVPTGPESNIHPADYAGPQACKECHPRNYDTWSHHPHRWMNALAGDATVKGDFSAAAAIAYRGGRATFAHEADRYLMRLERGGVRRTYAINQTIGSRFFQYYVGKQVEGPEPESHPFSGKDQVLPFGYWLDQHEWVPIVHVGPETADAERLDPYDPPDHGGYYAVYATSCNFCHTTFALADLFGRRPDLVSDHAPARLHWSMRPYLEQAHPEVLRAMGGALGAATVPNPMAEWEAPGHAVTLGVSCEACHLGARAHVASGGQVPPKFFPTSPHLAVEPQGRLEFGRTVANVNWACGRCHIGDRPQFAAGMSTWNSVEYTDAMHGSCYSQLRCIDCHNPHRALGPRWSASADRDDAVCLRCHGQFEPAPQRLAHTHHPAGSPGARCLNCHMPRLNEGIQDVVRTHMIYSPTRADMIEANHPNACNLCHTDRPIDWTLRTLRQWYGKTYDERALAAHYPDRAGPAALGWLKSDNPSVRLVAAAALTGAGDRTALPQLLDSLDDPYLINRQFAAKGLQEMLQLRLVDFGYRFYQTRDERRQPLANLRRHLVRAGGPLEGVAEPAP